jgi:hypothetical protein
MYKKFCYVTDYACIICRLQQSSKDSIRKQKSLKYTMQHKKVI